METVGVRDLKTHLSHHLKRVRSGVRLAVTERGRTIATLAPVEAAPDLDWAHQLVADGQARWNGGKPDLSARGVAARRLSASAAVLEDRR